MNNIKYYIVQDGEIVNPDVKRKFANVLTDRDVLTNRDGEIFNFVGIIFSNENFLISFPKHSFKVDKLQTLEKDPLELLTYIRTLFKCIRKTAMINDSNYVDIKRELNSDYPFSDFFKVYSYYKNYGLFTNEKKIKKFGMGGRINWNDTINKSPKIINNNNLLFLPLIVNDNINQHVFISKCMAYIINSTLNKFSLFLEGEHINLDIRDIDFSNRQLVLSQLIKMKRTLFKDVHQKLVDSLISFFKFDHKRGGDYQLKIFSFELVWEKMIYEFLKSKFIRIDENLNIEWSCEIQNNNFVKKAIYPDIRGKAGYHIEPDYYLISNNNRYIFDAKYYQSLNKLDYKQISYYFLLKNYENKRNSAGNIEELKTFNALFLPTENSAYNEIHFRLNNEYNLDEKDFTVMAYYLNTLEVMNNYVE